MRRLFLNLSNQVDLAVLPLASKILWVETSEIGGEHQKAQSNKISDWVRVARIKKATVDIRKGRGFMPLSGFARILSRLWHSDVCSSSLSRLICFFVRGATFGMLCLPRQGIWPGQGFILVR